MPMSHSLSSYSKFVVVEAAAADEAEVVVTRESPPVPLPAGGPSLIGAVAAIRVWARCLVTTLSSSPIVRTSYLPLMKLKTEKKRKTTMLVESSFKFLTIVTRNIGTTLISKNQYSYILLFCEAHWALLMIQRTENFLVNAWAHGSYKLMYL